MSMTGGHARTVLRGRGSECEALTELLDAARAGRSSVLVLWGEAGCGKTALLDFAVERATGFRIARLAGVESEMEVAFAGLHQLCGPMLDRIDHLPAPQRDAMRVAFGLQNGDAPERFLVGLAVLSLLSGVAEHRPVVCVIDDAHWLDRASMQSLAFVARRVMADPLALVFAVREGSDERELAGLPELRVRGLGERDARLVLESALRGRLDEQVRDRIVAETRGNPLALTQLSRGLDAAALAGGFGLPGPRAVESRIEQSFHREFQSMTLDTQRVLLLAAAEPTGDVALLWRAAGLQAIGAEAITPAVTAGLVELGARVRFSHPLVRSAVYRSASLGDRQAAHRALAEVTDPDLDPDRRAWHRAKAAAEPDEAVADEMERSAVRAQARGGAAAATAFLARATELTPGPARRSVRALAAAQAELRAGSPEKAFELLAIAEHGALDALQRAELERLRAQLSFSLRRGNDAPPLFLKAAHCMAPLDVGLARETYLDAFGAAVFAGRLGRGGGLLEAAQAAQAAPAAPHPPRSTDILLDGLATRFTGGYAEGEPQLKRALRRILDRDNRGRDELRWLWLACRVAPDLWDDELWHELATLQVRLARDSGALDILPIALTYRAGVCVHAGEFAAAAALIDEAEAITRAAGKPPLAYTSLVLAAWRGEEEQALMLIRASVDDATRRGEGRALTLAEYATAVLYNGLGDYEAALAAAQEASKHDDLGLCGWALIELVEAASRIGEPEVAAEAERQLGQRASASGTEWALGIAARSRALLSESEAAESLYREAIERLARSRVAVHLARTRLLYGEWLRREHRGLDARVQLREAHDLFSDVGAYAFAERARRELLATGETVRKRVLGTIVELTSQEGQIARMASEGMTNPEIAAQLFLSPRTVEWHLGKVFAKMDITSRRELRRAFSDWGSTSSPT